MTNAPPPLYNSAPDLSKDASGPVVAGAGDELVRAACEVEGEVAAEVAVPLASHPRLVHVDPRGPVGQRDDKGVARVGLQKEKCRGVYSPAATLPVRLLLLNSVLWRCYFVN